MANLAIDVMRKLYVDEDGFTMEDCENYLQLVSGAPLGRKQKAERYDQCTAITEYVRAADGDSLVAEIRSAIKLVSTKTPPMVLAALTAMDWRQALQERFPFLLERLTNDGPCETSGASERCIPYIDDIAKLGPYGADAAVQFGELAISNRSFDGSVNAHARVALEKVTVAWKGNVERRIKELANIIPESDVYEKKTLAEEAAAYASFPQYTRSVNNAFAPLLSNGETFMSAVTAIAGGGERSKDMVPQILDAVPKAKEEDVYRFSGDTVAHELEKIVGYPAIEEIRADYGWKCHCW